MPERLRWLARRRDERLQFDGITSRPRTTRPLLLILLDDQAGLTAMRLQELAGVSTSSLYFWLDQFARKGWMRSWWEPGEHGRVRLHTLTPYGREKARGLLGPRARAAD
jgi:DNA-binding MarR family transcriptional regulator